MAFMIDGQDAVQLNSKGYSWLHLPEGRHHIKTEHRSLLHGASGKMNIIIDVRAGETYHVERLDDSQDRLRYVSRLFVAKPQDAEPKIKSYKYTPALPPSTNAEQKLTEDPTKATVFLYRSSPSAAHIDSDITWSIDGKTVCDMEDRRFTVLSLDKGAHEFKVQWDPWKRPFFADAYSDKALKFNTEAGQVYYLNYQISGKDGTLLSTNLALEDEARAKLNLSLATHEGKCKK